MDAKYVALGEGKTAEETQDEMTYSPPRRRLKRRTIAYIAGGCFLLLTFLSFVGVKNKDRLPSLSTGRIFTIEDFKIPFGHTPQLTKEDVYIDVARGLNTSDSLVRKVVPTKDLRYAIIMPVHAGMFKEALTFFQSAKCLCTDLDKVDIHVVLSNSVEVEAFNPLFNELAPCNETYSRFKTPKANLDAANPKVNFINLYDVLPDLLKGEGVTEKDTGPLLAGLGKYGYVILKKLAIAFGRDDYDWALWLDAEAVAVRPFSMRETFDEFVTKPTVFRSRMAKENGAWDVTGSTAYMLGRSVDSFGRKYWSMESSVWIVERAVMADMWRWVEAAHGKSFWKVFTDAKVGPTNGMPFDINLVNMHIQARKLETVDPLYAKYQVLEVEREMLRFGMAPSFPHMEFTPSTGFLERGFNLLKTPEVQPNYSAFMRRYGLRLFRMDDVGGGIPPEVVDRFLLDTPIDLLVSGAPPLHEWWTARMADGTLRGEGETNRGVPVEGAEAIAAHA